MRAGFFVRQLNLKSSDHNLTSERGGRDGLTILDGSGSSQAARGSDWFLKSLQCAKSLMKMQRVNALQLVLALSMA
jgi:hypothetical protein